MKEENIPDLNIFMMCDELNKEALSDIPNGFHIRYCRKDELDIWKEFPFDNDSDKNEYKEYMTNYFNDVYAPNEELFYKSCLFLCDTNDKPIATCFAWKSYDSVYTIHWLKVLKGYEGMGLGRAIISEVMKNVPKEGYPIYLQMTLTVSTYSGVNPVSSENQINKEDKDCAIKSLITIYGKKNVRLKHEGGDEFEIVVK